MPFFERGYRAAAKTELERAARELEERNKTVQTRANGQETAAITFDNNVSFAQQIGLISAQEAAAYRKRVQAAKELKDQEEHARQTEEIVDGFSNPHEQAIERFTMEEAQAYVDAEKAREAAKEMNEPKENRSHSEEMERTSQY